MKNNTAHTGDSKPLWKELNEKRTQGKWETVNDIPSTSLIANAQYTALAVNNLHILAEALEHILKLLDMRIEQAEYGESLKSGVIYKKAKEALQKIS